MSFPHERTLTLNGLRWPRVLSFLAGAGMITASIMTIDHFFKANYPKTIFTGSFCDVSAFFNCDSSAFSEISQILGVPLGFFGAFMGLLIVLGAVFPSAAFERTNKSLSLLNVAGVVTLFLYSVFKLGSLCLLCSGFYLFSIFNFILFAVYGIDRGTRNLIKRWVQPSFKLLVVFALAAAAGGYAMIQYHDARKAAQTGTSVNIVKQFYELPRVAGPSFLSPYWSVKSTDRFEDAAIQIVEYTDFMCPDCLYLSQQMEKLKKDFAGKINVAIQFFPLDACNAVVPEKGNLHPGACELTYIAAGAAGRFAEIHDEIWANFERRKDPAWRRALAEKYGAAGAAGDPAVRDLVKRIIDTGAEYEKTSDKFSHGIRSTPTVIINNRMIIGTLPYEHLKAICQALVEEREGGPKKFIENWVEPSRRKK
ncbi:MAG TPA: vitamin K epoxide reductase family protein [Candidatus Aminicenantes bacterium]|nr:vitamin K epoxide reductase family protein [Candidatus Aminicenantes bacterium]HRY64910.1 vitamin K epoxide reductase family protein [Candidatus Aminicenantes bacterium]HRZ71823.1 vitamin K epoxide reductase family protein [Candidatus Aminicenantes bacterium]